MSPKVTPRPVLDKRLRSVLTPRSHDRSRLALRFSKGRLVKAHGRISFTSRSCSVPLARSTRPLTCEELAQIRPRKTTAGPVRVVFEVSGEPTLPISSEPDPRLVTLVLILALQAAREFVQTARDVQKPDGLPD